ncbi:hypothetical protein BGP75_24170 [Motiliproteus sp. MSK22-1]|nr:hypothetical protein BGP75_24170 [Motiliproteus sp. MSK22-1]
MIVEYLRSENFDVAHIDKGLLLDNTLDTFSPDLLILDLTLPDTDGLTLCKKVRPHFQGPILILTAQDEELTEVTALNYGADSFLTKPVRPHLLLAHINAQLRRYERPRNNDSPIVITIGELHLYTQKRELTLAGKQVPLSSSEFELLFHLMSRPGQVLSRDELFSAIRQREYNGTDRSLDMRISVLRRKLEDTRPPYKYIKTVRCNGYLFLPDNS